MKYYFSFDCEATHLHGPAFAVGYVVVDEFGNEVESGYYGCDILEIQRSNPTFHIDPWVIENVLPVLPAPTTGASTWNVRWWFWQQWLRWKEQGALMLTDCAWPVEANLLSACVADEPDIRAWQGPYPLLDVSNTLLSVGLDPVGTYPRAENESPAHNPVNDARQSARLFIKCQRYLREARVNNGYFWS